MSLVLHGIRNCDTVKKARAWLTESGVAHDFHDFKTQGADAALVGGWVAALGPGGQAPPGGPPPREGAPPPVPRVALLQRLWDPVAGRITVDVGMSSQPGSGRGN